MSTLKTIEDTGRQVFLAGLGVYGAGWKYTVEKFDETFTKSNEFVNDLITRGEQVEVSLQDSFQTKDYIETRIEALKEKLGLNKVSQAERVEELTAKVDNLTAAVNQLVASQQAKKTTNTVTKTTAKTAAKKVAGKVSK